MHKRTDWKIGGRVIGARWVSKPANYNCFPGVLLAVNGRTATIKCRDGKTRKFQHYYGFERG